MAYYQNVNVDDLAHDFVYFSPTICKFCGEHFVDPVRLPSCEHALCYNCADEQCERLDDKVSIQCPECKLKNELSLDGVKSLKIDNVLKQLVEIDRKNNPFIDTPNDIQGIRSRFEFPRRKGCSHFAFLSRSSTTSQFCEHCSTFFCSSCILAHVEKIRLEIAWYGHRFDERYEEAITLLRTNQWKSETMKQALSNIFDDEEPQSKRPKSTDEWLQAVHLVIDLAMKNSVPFEKLIADVFNQSVLHLPPAKVVETFKALVKRERELVELERLFGKLTAKDEEIFREGTFNFEDMDDVSSVNRRFSMANQGISEFPAERYRFQTAVKAGNLAAVKSILQHPKLPICCRRFIVEHYDYDEEEDYMCNSLHLTAIYGHVDVTKFLVEDAGADLYALAACTEGPDHAMANVLSAKKGQLEVLRYLCQRDEELLNLPDRVGSTPLIAASMAGHIETVRFLVESGKVDINQQDNDGLTSFYYAIFDNRREVAAFLAKIPECRCLFDIKKKLTFMISALDCRSVDVLQRLRVDKPELFNQFYNKSNGVTLLHHACRKGYVEIVQYLVDFMNVAAKCCDGKTALHYAAASGSLPIVHILLQKSREIIAEPSKTDGMTAAHIAAEKRHFDVARLLLNEEPSLAGIADKAGRTVDSSGRLKSQTLFK